MIPWLASLAMAQTCQVLADGEPVTRLDCAEPGAWRVRCTIPSGTRGKLRAHLRLPERRLEADARVPLDAANDASLELALMGPSGRAGQFLVEKAGVGLLPGQAVGPRQLCPVVQPGVTPGAPPQEIPVSIELTVHERTGFAEETMDGGVRNRVPIYAPGRRLGEAQALIVQLPVKEAEGVAPRPLPRIEEVAGTQKLRKGRSWAEFGWAGTLREIRLADRDEPDPSPSVLLTLLTFDAAAVREATGVGSASSFLESDLEKWLDGGYDSLLGLAAWRRSELEVPLAEPVAFRSVQSWRQADGERVQLRIGEANGQVWVMIAHRPVPLDDAARRAIKGVLARVQG